MLQWKIKQNSAANFDSLLKMKLFPDTPHSMEQLDTDEQETIHSAVLTVVTSPKDCHDSNES